METINLLKSAKEDFIWFKENFKEIQEKYRGEFVAIKDKSIINSDVDYFELLERLKSQGIETSEVIIKKVLHPNEVLMYHA